MSNIFVALWVAVVVVFMFSAARTWEKCEKHSSNISNYLRCSLLWCSNLLHAATLFSIFHTRDTICGPRVLSLAVFSLPNERLADELNDQITIESDETTSWELSELAHKFFYVYVPDRKLSVCIWTSSDDCCKWFALFSCGIDLILLKARTAAGPSRKCHWECTNEKKNLKNSYVACGNAENLPFFFFIKCLTKWKIEIGRENHGKNNLSNILGSTWNSERTHIKKSEEWPTAMTNRSEKFHKVGVLRMEWEIPEYYDNLSLSRRSAFGIYWWVWKFIHSNEK